MTQSKKLLEYRSMQTELCLYNETTSLRCNVEAELLNSIAYVTGRTLYIPARKIQEGPKRFLETFSLVFENEAILKIGQNVKTIS